jgi:hypothetical protein
VAEGSLDVIVRGPFGVQQVVEIACGGPVLEEGEGEVAAGGDELDGREGRDEFVFGEFDVEGLESYIFLNELKKGGSVFSREVLSP